MSKQGAPAVAQDNANPPALILRVAVNAPLPRLFDYLPPAGISNLPHGPDWLGRRVVVPFGRQRLTGVVMEVAQQSTHDGDKLRSILSVDLSLPVLPADWLALVRFVSDYYLAPIGEVVNMALPPADRDMPPPPRYWAITTSGRSALAELKPGSVAARLLLSLTAAGCQAESELRKLASDIRPALSKLETQGHITAASAPIAEADAAPELTPAQQAALQEVRAQPEGFASVLLHGVTGSGKTEVYLQLIGDCLAKGQQALMLVPEIALTPHLQAQVERRYPAAHVAVVHSAATDVARGRAFTAAQDGQADVVIGTRLGVFTPMPRLGLMLVDEEHDAAYKQQDGVRYSARDVAIWRARQRQVKIVLGSATPSLESWQHANTQRYALVSLPQRARAQATLPTLHCVDTRKLPLQEGLSPILVAAIEARLQRQEQSLVFINRRGFAPVLACPSCGWVSDCPHCAAHMVLHAADQRMRCHHCGLEGSVPHACPSCGNQDLHAYGRGTQRVEAALLERFPEARIVRVDRDAVRTPKQWQQVLAAATSGEADILVGTQMLSKGHDFPRLTLVGVVGADASLYAADFRAAERLFAQLLQVAGRAGRAELPGEVMIQTEHPDHPVYRALAKHDYTGFAKQQLDERERLGFPPFAYQALLTADAPMLSDALNFLQAAREAGVQLDCSGLLLYDPVPMRMMRRARRERAQLLVDAGQRSVLHGFLRQWVDLLQTIRAPRELRWHLDIDPQEI